eukprot:12449081-Ditylum_brightwellii.AAC.1
MIAPTRITHVAETTITAVEGTTILTTIKAGKVETTGIFTVGLMDSATIQVWTAKQRCRATRMKRHSKTKWDEAREDANDG